MKYSSSYNPEASRAEIGYALTNTPSPATLKRLIADGVTKGHIEIVGRGPVTRYRITPQAYVTMELNIDTYFDKDVDERQVQESFNFELINETLPMVDLFTDEELQCLDDAQELFRKHRTWRTGFYLPSRNLLLRRIRSRKRFPKGRRVVVFRSG